MTVTQAKPALEFIAPQFNPILLQTAKIIVPLWRQFRTPIADIRCENVDRLAQLYHQFQNGNIRFLLAFRHPSTCDPFAIAHLLWKEVPKTARQQGIPLTDTVHVHGLYDRGIPLWAGQWLGRVFAGLGATPIQRGKIDRLGLKSARDLFANGRFPMAASPEGGTNGHNEVISPLEPGIAQMGFWCVEDLEKSDRPERVFIVPLSLQYEYRDRNWDRLATVLDRLENDCGLPPFSNGTSVRDPFPDSPLPAGFYPRLIRIGLHLLSKMEEFYRRFYHQKLPENPPKPSELSDRLSNLLDVALTVAEDYFRLSPKGNLIDRCRRLEQAGWDRIYREDLNDFDRVSPLDRGLADRVAEEASLRMWHMRLVESFVAVTGRYVAEKPTFDRFAETLLLIQSTLDRIKGERRDFPNLGHQCVSVRVGEPLSVSDRRDEYKNSRRLAVASLTQDLQTALENSIVQ
jgi:hypothetical protein